jgi:glycogen(starch) synthase
VRRLPLAVKSAAAAVVDMSDVQVRIGGPRGQDGERPYDDSPRHLRILLVPSAYYPHIGGIEELTRQLALAFKARGHEAAVLTNRWPAGTQRREILDGIDVTRLSFPLPATRLTTALRFVMASPVAAITLVRHIHRWRADIVHVIGAGPPSAYLAVLNARLRAPLVLTAQGELTFDADRVFERSATLRAGLRRMLRHADAVTACSEFVMHDLERLEEIGGPSCVIPNGVEPTNFAGVTPARDFDPYVLGVGRLVPQKGFDVLLEALGADELAQLNLVLAGEGFERDRLRTRASALGIGSRVRFLGAVDRARLARLLCGARVFALPSRREPFGIALLEAMAAGVPAVATDAGGVPQFARDGDNALLVQPDDAKALTSAIARAAFDSELRPRLITGGRATAEAHAWGRIAAQYEEVYRRALDRDVA